MREDGGWGGGVLAFFYGNTGMYILHLMRRTVSVFAFLSISIFVHEQPESDILFTPNSSRIISRDPQLVEYSGVPSTTYLTKARTKSLVWRRLIFSRLFRVHVRRRVALPADLLGAGTVDVAQRLLTIVFSICGCETLELHGGRTSPSKRLQPKTARSVRWFQFWSCWVASTVPKRIQTRNTVLRRFQLLELFCCYYYFTKSY